MANVLKIKGNPNEATKKLLRYLMEQNKIDGVFALGKTDEGYSYLLATDIDKLEEMQPLTPFMPENAANLLSCLTERGAIPEKIAVVIRPCELRAFVELVKREQAIKENLVFLSPICGGVIRFDSYIDDNIEKEIPDYTKSFFAQKNPDSIRDTCTACEHFIPINADIKIITRKDSCEFHLDTPAAEEIAKDAPGDKKDSGFDEKEFEALAKARKNGKEKLSNELNTENFGIDGLVSTFGKCIGCHGCSSVCPICYCALCAFECKDNEFTPSIFENELGKRGSMRVPPNTVFYQLGRLTHMGISCVGCGMCSDVCPANIPVSAIFMHVGQATQKVFDYLPGRDYEEPVPLVTFEEKELAEVED